MKYILTIIFSLALVSPVYAFETPWQTFITGEGSNADTIVTTGVPEAVLMSEPIANPDAGTYTSTQTVTLTANGSIEIHYFFNKPKLNEELVCSDDSSIYSTPVAINETGLLRAIACYNSTDGVVSGPMASLDYTIELAGTNGGSTGGTTGSSGGNTGGGGGIVSTPPATDQADFDDSGDVDILDFNILISNWGDTSATKATGDADGNGTVDIFDFNILITNWSTV